MRSTPSAVAVRRLTQQQGGDEGRGHAAGAQEHSVTQLELALWDPAKDHGRDRRQEAHHSGLDLRMQMQTNKQTKLTDLSTETLRAQCGIKVSEVKVSWPTDVSHSYCAVLAQKEAIFLVLFHV